MTEITAQSIDEALRKQLDVINTSVESREVGTVVQIGDGIARIDGLKGAMAGELLEFVGEGGKTVYGLAQNLEEEEVGAVLLGDITAIRENDQCRTTGRILEIPSGKGMLGRVVNALGEPIDGKGPIEPEGVRPIDLRLLAFMSVSLLKSQCRLVSLLSTRWYLSDVVSANLSLATAKLVRPLSQSMLS